MSQSAHRAKADSHDHVRQRQGGCRWRRGSGARGGVLATDVKNADVALRAADGRLDVEAGGAAERAADAGRRLGAEVPVRAPGDRGAHAAAAGDDNGDAVTASSALALELRRARVVVAAALRDGGGAGALVGKAGRYVGEGEELVGDEGRGRGRGGRPERRRGGPGTDGAVSATVVSGWCPPSEQTLAGKGQMERWVGRYSLGGTAGGLVVVVQAAELAVGTADVCELWAHVGAAVRVGDAAALLLPPVEDLLHTGGARLDGQERLRRHRLGCAGGRRRQRC